MSATPSIPPPSRPASSASTASGRSTCPSTGNRAASSLAVIDGVKSRLSFMQERLPKGIELDVVMDQSEYVRQAIHALIHEGFIGAILVAAMIVLFLGNLRMTGIALLSIPLAILCALIGLRATGNTLNAMTLGGLALAIGPLVDNAIVVLDRILEEAADVEHSVCAEPSVGLS